MRSLCLDCLRSEKACLCKYVSAFETNSHFCLLMHPKEAKKQKVGTGRYTHLFLKNSSLFIGVSFDEDKRLKKILSDKNFDPFILYPGQNSTLISELKNKEPNNKKKLIIVIDGTWPFAKKIMRESKVLHKIPRISFQHNEKSKFIIKHQPDDLCLSTMESVAITLKNLEEIGEEEPSNAQLLMTDFLSKIVEFQIECAKDPDRNSYRKKPYSTTSRRSKAKKWEKRSIFFREER